MKNKALIITLLLSAFNLSAFAKADCDDPKNRPKYIGGGGLLWAPRKSARLFAAIGRNPVTGKVTSKAELAGGDKATNKLEAAQQNFGKAKTELEEAEKVYTDDASVKNSRRVDKARKAFKQAQLDLKAAEEIKEKADKNKDK